MLLKVFQNINILPQNNSRHLHSEPLVPNGTTAYHSIPHLFINMMNMDFPPGLFTFAFCGRGYDAPFHTEDYCFNSRPQNHYQVSSVNLCDQEKHLRVYPTVSKRTINLELGPTFPLPSDISAPNEHENLSYLIDSSKQTVHCPN